MERGRSGATGISAITLFVEDLEETKRFYREVFGLPLAFEDDHSAVFDFGNAITNLLDVAEAPELIAAAAIASRDAGSRMQPPTTVDHVGAVCAQLLNGPIDRPWGRKPPASAIPAGTSGRSRGSRRSLLRSEAQVPRSRSAARALP